MSDRSAFTSIGPLNDPLTKCKHSRPRPLPGHLITAKSFTQKQGQYLAFIYAYTRLNRRPPAEIDMQRYFQVSPPSVHQMVL